MENYRPLPDCLTIAPSEIEGLGLFATEDIPEGTDLGLSHEASEHYMPPVRTPLGGFYNHSEEPNCIKSKRETNRGIWWNLITLKDIKAGEEITVKYTLYEV